MKVLSTTVEDCRVYALLEDDSIIVSRPLDNHDCARVHAEQLLKLPLEAGFLQRVLGYELTDE